MSSDSTVPDDVALLRAAIDAGPTRGPWQVGVGIGAEGGTARHMVSIAQEDASYLAACSPDRIARVLDALAALTARLEAAERDAARYRWLRQQCWNDAGIACVVNPKAAVKLGHDCPFLERLDAAIDAATQEKPL